MIDNDENDLDFIYILGRTSDEEDGDEDQSDLNEASVEESYSIELSKVIPYKISKYYWKFLIDSISDDTKTNKEYWKSILTKFENHYNLNTIQLIKDNILQNDSDSISNIIYLISYIKLRLIHYIEMDKLDSNITLDNLIEFIEKDKAREIVLLVFKYLDRDSFNKFKAILFSEAKKDYVMISF